MKSPTPPKAPDPTETASAQTASNIGTAVAQTNLNNTNQITPEGTLTYNQTGTYKYTDPLSGEIHDVPQFTATTAYSPEQQALYEQQQQFDQQFNDIALQQTGKIGNLLGQPLDLSNEATESAIYDRHSQRLNDRFSDARNSLDTNLANRGIKMGSAAYSNALQDLGQQENDAYNQIAIQARDQALQEALTQRSAPINEITALMSGGQVSQPQFVNTQNTGVAGVDYAGLVNQKYQADMDIYNQKVASKNALLGGLFGIGSTALGAFSDARVKHDVKRIGYMDNGLPIYAFRYDRSISTDQRMQIGLMAQDVEQVMPEAVGETGGIKTVDYGMVARAV